MSLPRTFSSHASDYLEAALAFLQTHAWIYQHANTRCLRAGVLQSMPPGFVDFFLHASNEQLNTFPLLHAPTSAALYATVDESVRAFRAELQTLIPASAYDDDDERPAASGETTAAFNQNARKVSAKKRHEIAKLSRLIHAQLKGGGDAAGPHLLLDFGAGLGYLSSTLYRRAPGRYLLLGFEADAYRVSAASAHLKRQTPPIDGGDIVYREAHITAASQPAIEGAAAQLLQERGLCDVPIPWTIIGLHACADLSVAAIQLFFQMRQVRRLIIMPCCYHKLQRQRPVADDAGDRFVHFPLSACLRRLVAASGAASLLNRPFLRLAAQQSSARWAECTAAQHAVHGRGMFWRAAAEMLAADAAVVVSPKGDAKDRPPGEIRDFSDFQCHYALRCRSSSATLPWTPQHEEAFDALCATYATADEQGARLAEGLTCLQAALQKLCENFVLYDRLCYMEERGRELGVPLVAHFQKLLNEKLSPRCFVLIAHKLE